MRHYDWFLVVVIGIETLIVLVLFLWLIGVMR